MSIANFFSGGFYDEHRCDIIAYGIAFSRKRCKAIGERL